MKQLNHIFIKDIRYLWSELLLFAAFLGLYVWTELHADMAFITLPVLGKVMLPLGAAYLIARLIHAEAIPGHNQFWLTRPYRWESLLGAKLAFILLCVNLPMFAARLTLLLLQDFPLSPGMLNLAWSQFVMMVVVSLPLAAIAALTSGLASFVAALVIGILVPSGLGFLDLYSGAMRLTSIRAAESNAWIPAFYTAMLLMLAAGWLLRSQYKSRRTWLSRAVALAMLVTGSMMFLHIPEAMAARLNAWIAEPLLENSSIQFRLAPEMELQPFRGTLDGFVISRMPVTISGISDGYHIYVPSFSVTLPGAAGMERVWFSGWSTLDKAQPAVVNYRAEAFSPDSSQFAIQSIASKGDPIRARASVDLFLFPPPRTKEVRFGNTPVDVIDGLQCYFNPIPSQSRFRATRCRAAVGWPGQVRISMARGEPAETKKFDEETRMSFSPFPSGALSLNSIEERSLGWTEPVSPEFTVSVLGPPRHFHREIDLNDIHVIIRPAIERRP